LATEKRSSSAKNKKLAIFSEFHNFLNRKKTFFREIRKEAKLNSRDRGCFSSLISRCDLPNAASKNKLTLVEWSKCFDLPIQVKLGFTELTVIIKFSTLLLHRRTRLIRILRLFLIFLLKVKSTNKQNNKSFSAQFILLIFKWLFILRSSKSSIFLIRSA